MGRAGDSRELDRDEPGIAPPAAVSIAGEPPSAVAQRIRALQQTAGNQAVGRLIARTVARQVEAPPAAADLGAVADEIYEALDGWNDEGRALRALEGHDAGARAEIKSQFQQRHGESLASYLQDQLDDDWLVEAFALLESSNLHEPHTRLALALIPLGTRDDELLRILEGVDHAHRLQIQDAYNRTFAAIGEGSLDADLEDDLSGWELEKCRALMARDLTGADHLYFNSVAIAGTHDDSVVSAIQGAWARGPAAFAQLNAEWDQHVRNGDGKSGGWTGMSLREAMDDELSGEAWELVLAVLDGYDELAAGAGGAAGADDDARDAAELRVAEDSFRAATTGGYTGAGTNEDQVYTAIQRIRDIWLRRIERAAEPRKAELQAEWEQRRTELAAATAEEMDTDGAEYQRARLLLSGALTPADEVWLASRELDNDKVVKTLVRHWGAGRMDALLEEAARPRLEGETELRPRYDVLFTVPVTSGTPSRRVSAITNSEYDDAARGSRLIRVELDEGDDDSDLRRAYEVLSAAETGLRTAAIETFAATHLGNVEGDTAAHKFIAYVAARYENSTTVYDVTDMLDPASSAEQMVERAEGRQEASRSGLFDAVLEDYIRDYDAITGEDTLQLADESLERLKWIAQHATPTELAAIAAVTGRTVDQLARLEYTEFQQRLAEIQALKQAIADAIATAGELLVSAVLTAASGGAAAGLFAAALSSAVAGMVVREALLGQQYDLISRENAGRLAGVMAGAALGSLGSELFSTAVGADQLRQLTRVQAFMQDVTQEAFSQVGTTLATQAFSDKVPTAEQLAAGAVTMLGNVAGAGTRGALRWTPDQAALQVRQMFVANLAQATVGQTTEQLTELARDGSGNLTGPEIAGRFARRGVGALQQSLFQTAGDAALQARQQAAAQESDDARPAGDRVPPVPGADDAAPAAHGDEAGPVGAVRGPTYEQAEGRQIGGRRFQQDVERFARGGGRARDAAVVAQAPPDAASAAARMTVTRPDGTTVDIDVTIRPRPGAALPEGSHGAESGPARYEIHAPDPPDTVWRAEISVDENTYRDDLLPMLGHEFDEMADILHGGATTREQIEAQQQAGVYRTDPPEGATVTAHDRATARELFRLNEDVARLELGLRNAQRGHDERGPEAIADWHARLRRRSESMQSLVDSMGLDNPANLDLKVQTLREAGSTEEWNEVIVRVQELGSRPIHDALTATLPAGTEASLDVDTVAHLAFPNPHAPDSGAQTQGVFRARGIVGGHDGPRLRAFVDDNPRYGYALVEEGRRNAAGTDFVSYAQYMWIGDPAAIPRPGDADYPVAGGGTPPNWVRADDPKTVAEDFGTFLREADAAFRAVQAARGADPVPANRQWVQLSPGGVEIGGFYDQNNPDRAATAFIEDGWVRGGGGG